ncbi:MULTISPECIES: TolC family protein [Weeksellaceae]|uniref:Heavy metal RND efflux outer membrane protein, CzcC family n=2 Tax=Elizabethkingia anophelis TaxID=1117645 RepID=A0A455ZGT7_9FLAO|nr:MULTISPECIES: TolC family protein [Elizabethkingia]AIL45289.1 Heavy metal RND efflux outer membrane protein, CzcC family [Elizabethkingia anophelis NUHP1]MCL1641497.1 TolC family protein [Elizabethkingia anophelis]MCL1646308.1 TolC family protein [Elizabethkingia anophelis]DAC75884.1 TPA_exp: heavy metal RND efflux outer membrane protein, CzcC family [Elizabethkingia anophelis]DAC75974.1 TPA_exp: heavy metal RND efflux outer membrane protein, CzcC family [Elizabethkingia anophelis]
MKKTIFIALLLLLFGNAGAQVMSLQNIIDSIEITHPIVKMYDSEIRSMDQAAKGARNWMPPTVGVGQFMTPYNVNLWKRRGEMQGMGSVMISIEQMFPNRKKLDAEESYMKAMSSVEKENKKAGINQIVQDAKLLYYEWIIILKRLSVVDENEKMLDFMIRNAEIRYKNGTDKISAYYKAKAALGNTKNMRLMYENNIKEKRIRLNALMNRNVLISFDIDTTVVFNDYSTILFDKALFNENRSDLKSLDRQINLTVLKQESERQSLKPEFGVRFENMFGFGGQPTQYTLMAMVKLPFLSWSSKMNKANIESLKWKANALGFQKEMMVNEYSGMAYGMRNEFDLKKKQLELYQKEIIPALKNNFKTMQLGYEQNTEELFMLYDAWEKLNMTQLEYFDIMSKAIEMQVTIDRLIEKR